MALSLISDSQIFMFTSVMIKKQLILTLAFLFFVSTTGLPLSIHLCKMAGTVSTEECEMCIEENQPVKKSCCQVEDEYEIAFKSDNSSGCCETQIVDASVKDKFISVKVDKKEEASSTFISTQINSSIDFISFKEVSFYTDTSPPHLQNNNLYLINSIFLI